MAFADLRDDLDCSICLNVFTDPVTLRCGHNFCHVCIDQMMDAQDGAYSCPECRDKFRERPVLKKNVTLCKIVRGFLHSEPCKEATKILCTHCVDSPVLAVKSCLHCETSLCDTHLRVHSDSAEHVLSEPSDSLDTRKCPIHKKILEYFCTEDDTCVCMSCSLVGEHRGHRVENLVEASEKKKEKLRNALQKLAPKMQNLETKKNELSRKMRHLEELCTSNNPVNVLQEPDTCNLCDPGEEMDDEYKGGPDVNLPVITGTFHEELLPFLVSKNGTVYPLEKAIMLLDVRTASNEIYIPSDLMSATRTFTDQNRPYGFERFMHYQVLSRKSFSSGRHYWDVDVSRSCVWMVGMCYPSIGRGGTKSIVGSNNKSWGLHGYRGNTRHAVRHNDKVIQLPRAISSHRVRIYLDYEAGLLSFYELCDPIRHLYTFTATFTEPLHVQDLWALQQGPILTSDWPSPQVLHQNRMRLKGEEQQLMGSGRELGGVWDYLIGKRDDNRASKASETKRCKQIWRRRRGT
ncbi:E3 ubiquitin/ISG15 ligase TRIM25-like [Dendropsophus ebraccatus]|uniref:E3 ubiquitin/ISG15 ligase TRIM25-like n=1 Tax=Dendropsophus ebraccatus TaxID=150705 RepID=UPI003831B7A2